MDASKIEPKEKVSASAKLGSTDAAALAKAASKVIVLKGKKRDDFKGGSAGKEVIAAMLGPTGNLRAPALRAGKTVIVGFNEDAYTELLG